MKQKKTANKIASVSVAARKRRAVKKHRTVGKRIIEGLEQAVAWTRGDNHRARVTLVHVPDVDVREVRKKMGLSQAQFATKFGLPPATLRNWEQGRLQPDAPTRVLLAVIAKHLGNIARIGFLRGIFEQTPKQFPLLLSKVVYNGI